MSDDVVDGLVDVVDSHTMQPAPPLTHITRIGVDAAQRIVYLGEIEEDDGE